MLNYIIICSSIIYSNVTLIIYSLLSNAICSKITDAVIIGTDRYYIVNIMSDRYLDITEYVNGKLKRGVTFIQGMDTTNVKKKMLIQCVINKQELVALKDYINELHDDSFVYISESAGLIGKGYPQE